MNPFKKSQTLNLAKEWKNAFVERGNKQLLVQKTSLDPGTIKNLVFELKKEVPKSIIVILSSNNNKPMIAVGVSDDLAKEHQAGNIIKNLAKEIEGGGGGNPGFASAGGKKPEGLEIAYQKALLL